MNKNLKETIKVLKEFGSSSCSGSCKGCPLDKKFFMYEESCLCSIICDISSQLRWESEE